MAHYFYLPEVAGPSGGVNVLMQMIAVLQEAGYDAAPLYGSPHYAYPFDKSLNGPFFYEPRLRDMGPPKGMVGQLRSLRRKGPKRASGTNQKVTVGPGDVVVVPEVFYANMVSLLPDCAYVLAAQAISGLVIGRGRDSQDVLRQMTAIIAISDACADVVTAMGLPDPLRVSLEVGYPALSFGETKKRQVAYMPRKVPDDVRFVTEVLKASPEFEGYDFVAIDRMTRDQVADVMRESLFFLYFAEREGFGLPPAEAMLSGCIVMGYPAIGALEYFTPDTGIPVADGDVAGLIGVARAAAAEYAQDPERLDTLRRSAAATVVARYPAGQFKRDVLAAWAEIDARLQSP